MKKTALTILLALACACGMAQQNDAIPLDSIRLEAAEDYKPWEGKALEAAQWVMNASVKQINQHLEIPRFMLRWISGCPYIQINMNTDVFPFDDDTADFIIVFFAGYSEYVIRTKDDKDELAGHKAAVEACIRFYQNNIEELPTIRGIEKLIRLQGKGELEEHIKQTLEKAKEHPEKYKPQTVLFN